MAMFASFPFPYKVHVILERGFNCIKWCGPNSFRLVDPNEFEKILPHFFKHEKLSSFTRQLNIYGFHKIREGPLKGAYTHEDFMRGDLERVSSIPRAKRSGPREEMKVRESRNASVIYSTMMMNQSNPTDDESSGTEYASDSSRAGASAFVDTKTRGQGPSKKMGGDVQDAWIINDLLTPVNPKTTCTRWANSNKRKRDNNDASDIESSKQKRNNTDVSDRQPCSNSLAILEKARFVYKERSYDELKSQTEKNDSKGLTEKIQVHRLVKEEILPSSRKPEFESESDFEDDDLSDCDLSDCAFSVLPLAKRSITQQIAEESESENGDVKVDTSAILKSEPTPRTASAELDLLDEFADESEKGYVNVDASAILKSEPNPRTASAEYDLLDEFSYGEADLNFDLDDGAHIYVFGQPVQQFSAVC